MSCLEFRRFMLLSTHHLPAHLARHAQECRCCADFLQSCTQLEKKLEDAVRVDPPSGLAERILLAQRFKDERPRPRPRRYAWAAGAAATAALALAVLRFTAPPLDLAMAAIRHVRNEPRSFTLVNAPDPQSGQRLLAEQGVPVPAGLGVTRYLSHCSYAGQAATHLVFDGAMGKVTILLPVNVSEPPRQSMTIADGMTSVVVPTARSFIAVVAERNDAVEQFTHATTSASSVTDDESGNIGGVRAVSTSGVMARGIAR